VTFPYTHPPITTLMNHATWPLACVKKTKKQNFWAKSEIKHYAEKHLTLTILSYLLNFIH